MRSTAYLRRYTHRQRRAHQPGLASPDRCSRSFHRSRIDAARAASILLAARAAESPRITNVRAGDCSCVSGISAIHGRLARSCIANMPAIHGPVGNCSCIANMPAIHGPVGNCSCIANMPAIHGPQKKSPRGQASRGRSFRRGRSECRSPLRAGQTGRAPLPANRHGMTSPRMAMRRSRCRGWPESLCMEFIVRKIASS